MTALQLSALVCFMTVFQIGFVDAFKSDYTFVESTLSYYKLHRNLTPWIDAKSNCESEGSVLFYPDNKAEILQVFSALDIGKNFYAWIDIGISSLKTVNVFKTVDGRPMSQVYNTWSSREPRFWNGSGCVFLNTEDYSLAATHCTTGWPYICKHSLEKAINANASLRIANLERPLANKSTELVILRQMTTNQTMELEILKPRVEPVQLQDANHDSVFERLVEAVRNQSAAVQLQTKAIKQLIANPTSTLKQIAEVNGNQLIVYLLEAVGKQAAAMDKQAAAMDKQAVVLEKLVNLHSNNDQLDARSQQ